MDFYFLINDIDNNSIIYVKSNVINNRLCIEDYKINPLLIFFLKIVYLSYILYGCRKLFECGNYINVNSWNYENLIFNPNETIFNCVFLQQSVIIIVRITTH